MAASSSSSSIILQVKYDVFLSFRGEDTRDNITSHLYAALRQKKIQTFIDYDGLKRGDEISPVLLKAIGQSKVSVIIFSKDYASSKWCLDELVKILECKANGQIVMPIFYHVTPSDVRKQMGSFEDAFVKHEQDFNTTPEKVQRWRAALTEASNLSGWDSAVIRPESKLVSEIVREIWRKLNNISLSSCYEGLVGIDSHIDNIMSLLCIGLSDFQIVGIWGMGGIGKTTIAGAIYNQISNQFEGCCFITNVREESEKRGMMHLREQVLSKILEEENVKISTPNMPQFIKERLQRKKVLIVFDDIDDLEKLEFLTGGIYCFNPGSIMIVTTRDKQVLCSYGVDNIYQVEGLKYHEALQLFSNYAFKQKCPPHDFWEISDKIVDYSKGNPLALKMLGSSLYQKTKPHWEGVAKKLSTISNPKIYNVLKISYDGLDYEEQNIFLDIACFFKGENSVYIKYILNSCYLSPEVGFNTLIDRSLITISNNGQLEIHDLLQEMGWEIVRQESITEPGKRSRLWNHKDAFHVLKNKKGTTTIQGLFLDMSKITDLHLNSGAFENMPNLKFLKFYIPDQHIEGSVNIPKVHLPEGLKYLPDELRYLHWHGYPLKALPSSFRPENLIELKLPYSDIDEEFWIEKKPDFDVKSTEPNDSNAPQLEYCQSLLNVLSISKYLTNLCFLNLSGCKSLTNFPSDINFRSLTILDLSWCTNLAQFPHISENIKALYLEGTKIEEIPASISHLSELQTLDLWDCNRLKSISNSIYKLKSLDWFGLSNYRISPSQLSSIASWEEITGLRLVFCSITEIPEDFFCLPSLERLDLSGNDFHILPVSIKRLSKLKCLSLRGCSRLQSIPELPTALEYFNAVNCRQLQSLPEPPSNLEELGELELATVSECFDPWSTSSMSFVLTNCVKLNENADNNILINSRQRIQQMANAALRLCYEKVFDEISHFSLCFPGSEIPNWFSHQSSGSSITVEIPQRWCDRWFIGFAISAVIAFEPNYYKDHAIIVACIYFLQDNDSKSDCLDWISPVNFVGSKEICSESEEMNLFIESDHLVLGYSPFMDIQGEYTTASFEFSPLCLVNEDPAEGCQIKCCGVHPLYAQPNMNLPSTSINERSTSEEVEPHCKKICRN